MAWKLQALGFPVKGEPLRWSGTLSSRALPHGVLACRAAVLNLLSLGMDLGVSSWEAAGAITVTPVRRRPISVAYGAIEVPAITVRLTDETVHRRSIFDLLLRMRDPGLALAELEYLAARTRLGADPVTGLVNLSGVTPTPSIYEVLRRIM